jgi:DNA modification methylase
MTGSPAAAGTGSVLPQWAVGPVTLYTGDAHQVLAGLPAESVDCIVTSPPYWGLRDYGTGRWQGGLPGCGHEKALTVAAARRAGQRRGCPSCGAAWEDQQHGLEVKLTDYVDRLVAVFAQARRVLDRGGTMWLNLGDCYASGGVGVRGAPLAAKNLLGVPWRVAFALQADGWWLRNAIVWAKRNPMPESVRDRLSTGHEMIFLLTRSRRYHFDLDAIRIPLADPAALGRGNMIGGTGKGPRGAIGSGSRRHGRNTYGPAKYDNPDPAVSVGNSNAARLTRDGRHDAAHPRGKNPGDVWHFATRPSKEAHFAAFPVDIPLRCVAAGCRRGGTVLDPFSGAATTGLAAVRLHRRYVGIDLNPDYTAMARRRLGPHLPAPEATDG